MIVNNSIPVPLTNFSVKVALNLSSVDLLSEQITLKAYFPFIGILMIVAGVKHEMLPKKTQIHVYAVTVEN